MLSKYLWLYGRYQDPFLHDDDDDDENDDSLTLQQLHGKCIKLILWALALKPNSECV